MLWQCQLGRALERLGFLPDLKDPAVHLHQNGPRLVTYVDDSMVAGEHSQIEEIMTAWEKEFRTTVKDALDGRGHASLGRSLRWVKPGHIVFEVGTRYMEDAFNELELKKDPTAKKMPTWTKQSAASD